MLGVSSVEVDQLTPPASPREEVQPEKSEASVTPSYSASNNDAIVDYSMSETSDGNDSNSSPAYGLQHHQTLLHFSSHQQNCQDGGGSGRKVRVRSLISDDQLRVLRSHYVRNPKPKKEELERIADEIGFNVRVVQVWFQNTRARDRREGRSVAAGDVTITAVGRPTTNGLPAASR